MSKGSVNKVIIVGNLGADPEMRTTGSGSTAANMTIATSESWTDKGSGERTERTEWHRVVAWGRLAEICETYLRKGSKVYIEGRLQTRKWQDKDGADRYTTEIVASELVMLGGRVLDEAQEPRTAPQPAAAHQSAPKARRSLKDEWEAPAKPQFDDDIPF